MTDTTWARQAEAVMPLLVSGTPFENRWQINGSPRNGFVNLYFLKSGLKHQRLPAGASALLGNCTYAGEHGIIFCDSDFLAEFLPMHGFDTVPAHRTEHVAISVRTRETFLFWVLGHELGHIVNGDGAVHFGNQAGMEQPIARDDLNQKRELKADEYCARRAYASNRSLDLETFLLGLVNNEIEAKVGVVKVAGVGILWDYTNKKVVEYLNAGDHPEYVVRATRLLIATGNISGDPAITNLSTAFMKHMRQKQTPSSTRAR